MRASFDERSLGRSVGALRVRRGQDRAALPRGTLTQRRMRGLDRTTSAGPGREAAGGLRVERQWWRRAVGIGAVPPVLRCQPAPERHEDAVIQRGETHIGTRARMPWSEEAECWCLRCFESPSRGMSRSGCGMLCRFDNCCAVEWSAEGRNADGAAATRRLAQMEIGSLGGAKIQCCASATSKMYSTVLFNIVS